MTLPECTLILLNDTASRIFFSSFIIKSWKWTEVTHPKRRINKISICQISCFFNFKKGSKHVHAYILLRRYYYEKSKPKKKRVLFLLYQIK